MKIALIGYGKMGKQIEELALEAGDEIVLRIDKDESGFNSSVLREADVAIEFSLPAAAFSNVMKCFEAGIPVISGTTGWNDKLAEIKKICSENNHSFFYASNFSIGVNILFSLNRKLASLMNSQPEYEVSVEEIHHTHKLDAPSGTSITLAGDIIDRLERKTKWNAVEGMPDTAPAPEELDIYWKRIDEVPGIHTIKYESSVDSIELKHSAFNRKGFALGALTAARWMIGKKGVFGMNDMLNLY